MKRLVICCDGTWNSADQRQHNDPSPTNVVQLAFRTAKHDGCTPQVTWYNQGVGTGGNVLDRATGGAFGSGLEANLHAAYRFLIANFELGDELFLCGFSRGAFTVRSLAGMIRKCGILRRDAVAMVFSVLDGPLPAAERARLNACSSPEQDVVLGVWSAVFENSVEELDALASEMLSGIHVPYLAIHGSDPGVEYVHWLLALVANARVEVWPDTGHYPHLMDPERFAERLDQFDGGL